MTPAEALAAQVRRTTPLPAVAARSVGASGDLAPLDITRNGSGEPICDAARPDLIPYPHDQYVSVLDTACDTHGPVPDPYRNGKYVWLNESEIRLLWGPMERLACKGTDDAQVYISNAPGTGITGDAVSNGVQHQFVCKSP